MPRAVPLPLSLLSICTARRIPAMENAGLAPPRRRLAYTRRSCARLPWATDPSVKEETNGELLVGRRDETGRRGGGQRRTELAHRVLGRRGLVREFVGRSRMLVVGARMLGSARSRCGRGDRAHVFGPF